ncbi:MAG: hypothetical protein KDK97_21065 [Verrucomicrobiales bacterium]|nr:hypothetical protein [Verrucomicrobiales bacterium]
MSAAVSAITSLIDPSPLLTKGADVPAGVMLQIGDLYVWGLLGLAPILVIAALVLIRTMYVRVEFFALEFGRGGFWGRVKAINHIIALGFLMVVVGAAAGWLGWLARGYSVTLTTEGVVQVVQGETLKYGWSELSDAPKHIRSTSFGITFARGESRCRVLFRQQFIGEKLQDKAIAIAENAVSMASLKR